MTARRTGLGTRLLVAMVSIAVGVLVFTGLATLVLARQAAVHAAEQDLRAKLPQVRNAVRTLERRLAAVQPDSQSAPRQRSALRTVMASILRVSGSSIVTILPDGTVSEGLTSLATGLQPEAPGSAVVDLPPGVQASDLDATTLQAGQVQSGQRGSTVFVAAPLPATARGTPVVVLTQEVGRSLARVAGPFFLVAAAVAIGVAALVAYFLSRRLTRPIAAMDLAAGKLAAGDLSARVDPGPRPPDELAGLADTLNAMAGQLELARGQERAFLLNISHDLRTPLTSIQGYAEAISDGAVEGPDGDKRAAAVISGEARRLERLVADLLDLARLDARQFSFRPRPFDAGESVRASGTALLHAAAELGIALDVQAPGPVAADADPERVGQIVANLVENALKYAASAVVVTAGAVDGWLRIAVSDDGPGIDPGDLPHVFERLYTSRTAPGRKVGTGLGLAIVRELTTVMGGRVDVQRAELGGATFVVWLPVLAPPAAT